MSAGERLEPRTLLAASANVIGGELKILLGAANDVVTLTAYEKHFTVTGTGLGSQSFWNTGVKRISVADSGVSLAGQTLIVGGSVPVTRPLAVSNIEKTLLGTSVVNTANAGDVVFGGPLLLPTDRPITVRNTQGGVVFGSTVDGASRLTIDAPNQSVSFKGKVGGVTPLTGLSFSRARGVDAGGTVAIDGKGSATTDGLVFGAGVGTVTMAVTGSSVKACRFGIVVEAAAPPQATVSRQLAGFDVSGNVTGVRFLYPQGAAYSAAKPGFYRWTIRDSVISRNSLHGIHLTADSAAAGDVRETLFRKNVISQHFGDGVRVETPATGIRFESNYLLNNGSSVNDAAIRLVGAGTKDTMSAESIAVVGNTIAMTVPPKGRATPATGILAVNARQLKLQLNTITDLTVGISLSGASSYGCQVVSNALNRPRSVGMVLDSTQAAKVWGNSVSNGSGIGLMATGDCAGTVVGGAGPSGLEKHLDNAGDGVLLYKARNLTVQHVVAEGNRASGLHLVGDCSGTVIDGASVRYSGNGIVLESVAGLTIRNSSVVNNTGNGLVASGDCPSKVIWSTFSNNGQNGIVLANARNLAFIGAGGDGFAHSNGAHGLVASGGCQGTLVNGWRFSGNASCGVVLDNAAGVAVFGAVSASNQVHGLLALGGCAGSTVASSTFEGNQYGVSFSGAKGLSVNSGNTVKTNKFDGLYVTGDCQGSTFSVNTVSANGNAGLGLYAARQVTVTGNTVSGNKSFGLFANGVATGSTVMNNIISGSVTNVSVTATGGTFQKG